MERNSDLTGASQTEQEIISHLVDEYKILQDKIDKIGAFRFTIKGWTVTLLVAAVFAGKAFAVLSHWTWFVGVSVLLLSFFLYEKEQTDLRYKLGKRSWDVEAVISRLLRKAAEESEKEALSSCFLSLHYIPGISHYVRSHERRPPDKNTYWNSFRKKLKPYREADLIFYLILLVLSGVFAYSGNSNQETQNPETIFVNQNEIHPLQDSSPKRGEQRANANTAILNGKKPQKTKR